MHINSKYHVKCIPHIHFFDHSLMPLMFACISLIVSSLFLVPAIPGNRLRPGAAPGMPGAGFLLPPPVRGRKPEFRGRAAPGIPGFDSGGGNRGREPGAGIEIRSLFSC